MKILGIEMKANEANICLLEQTGQLFGLPDCRTRKLNLVDINSAEQLRSFQFAVKKLAEDYGVEKVVIKQRQPKGKFAGSAHGFKMEAALQLIDDLPVEIVTAAEIKAQLKEQPMPILFADTGLKMFQEQAFITAYVGCWLAK
ncbi:hypothetical protein SIN8267_02993 [Sinobacterium norvegicum]|uniref:DUF3010 family protein n=1 Tax=Sinobacterium norvegicum TaxID=1641715 RepID=A0ABN8EKB1_9GAMM|nr:DUF3010 family protein [Sinobacterium norvegicum]CAH0992856.1 hypothetical protein SIN8267_02993 [Sinobacterium norvegicum]